jgi:hypothetical protein
MIRTIFTILSLVIFVAPAARAEDAPAASAPQTPAWTDFQSTEHGFSVAFPGTPKTTNVAVEGQNPLVKYDFSVGVGDNIAYRVVAFEYPAGKAPNPPDADYYLKLVNAYAKGTEARLRKRGTATISGREGYEAIADDNKKQVHLIDVIPGDNTRVYMLVTLGPKGHAGSDDAKRFRDSFKVLADQPATPDPTSTGTTSSSSTP